MDETENEKKKGRNYRGKGKNYKILERKTSDIHKDSQKKENSIQSLSSARV